MSKEWFLDKRTPTFVAMDRTSEATHNSVKASRSLFLTDSHGHTENNNISSTYKLFKVGSRYI